MQMITLNTRVAGVIWPVLVNPAAIKRIVKQDPAAHGFNARVDFIDDSGTGDSQLVIETLEQINAAIQEIENLEGRIAQLQAEANMRDVEGVTTATPPPQGLDLPKVPKPVNKPKKKAETGS